jgi:hypothetical protein
MHENRETSGAPRPERERGRSAKAQSHTADAHALEESDRAILSMNQTNKEERSHDWPTFLAALPSRFAKRSPGPAVLEGDSRPEISKFVS